MFKKAFLLIGILIFSIHSCKNDTQPILVANGESKYKIIIADQAKPIEIAAADSLKKYLYQISNVSFEIVSDINTPSDYELLIGSTNRDESKSLNSASKKTTIFL